jgi:hypothetical protein
MALLWIKILQVHPIERICKVRIFYEILEHEEWIQWPETGTSWMVITEKSNFKKMNGKINVQ